MTESVWIEPEHRKRAEEVLGRPLEVGADGKVLLEARELRKLSLAGIPWRHRRDLAEVAATMERLGLLPEDPVALALAWDPRVWLREPGADEVARRTPWSKEGCAWLSAVGRALERLGVEDPIAILRKLLEDGTAFHGAGVLQAVWEGARRSGEAGLEAFYSAWEEIHLATALDG